MELRHLRYFIAVATAGSLTEAAEHVLHTSQPSLSRQIRDLEDEVGVALLSRTARGIALTPAGKVFLEQAKGVLAQLDAGVEATRRAAEPTKPRFALGFLTGQEMIWLPKAMGALRSALFNVDVTVSSDYSPDLAEAVARGKVDAAFMRAEPGYDLAYRTVAQEALIALMPSDHPLAQQTTVSAQDLEKEPFIAMANKAKVLRAVVDAYFARAGVTIRPAQRVDNPAMVMSLVASTRGVTVIASYVQNLMPWSVVSRPLSGVVPTIDLVIGYRRTNTSPILRLLLDGLDELTPSVSE